MQDQNDIMTPEEMEAAAEECLKDLWTPEEQAQWDKYWRHQAQRNKDYQEWLVDASDEELDELLEEAVSKGRQDFIRDIQNQKAKNYDRAMKGL